MLVPAIALNRFGLGARSADPLPSDPKAWLLEQLRSFDPRPPAIAAVPSRAQVVEQLAELRDQQRMDRANKPRVQQAALVTGIAQQPTMQMRQPMGTPAKPNAVFDPEKKALQQAIRADYVTMTGARLDSALTTNAPFVERLVHFWANHFAVSIDKQPVVGLAGLLEFEAIRPHVLGRFSDMLLAVEQHPAMLLYLDQAQSIGPNSMAGERVAARGGKRGLNENLGREIMELHTLGVRTGYTQADVTEFARALTGWTVTGLAQGPVARLFGEAPPGQFAFVEALHEPGARTIMGKRYPQDGEAQARAILMDLAGNPATAKHVSFQLARHFAGDSPPQPLVDRLTKTYLASGGDLPSLYRTLIESPEAWAAQPVKFKTPWEWSVSALRALDLQQLDGQKAVGLMNQMGQPVWKPGSPAGYDDIAASWAAPEALMQRVEAAKRIADAAGSSVDPRSLAEKVLPGSLTDPTRMAISRAESPQEGLALLLVSPEFLRR
jgi:uncharacterized protein (DUF1800 family)